MQPGTLSTPSCLFIHLYLNDTNVAHKTYSVVIVILIVVTITVLSIRLFDSQELYPEIISILGIFQVHNNACYINERISKTWDYSIHRPTLSSAKTSTRLMNVN